MGLTQSDQERAERVLKNNTGKHSSIINLKFQAEFGCGSRRAGNILRHLVNKNLAYIDGFKVYSGGPQ